MFKKKTLICLLLICAMVLPVIPAAAEDARSVSVFSGNNEFTFDSVVFPFPETVSSSGSFFIWKYKDVYSLYDCSNVNVKSIYFVDGVYPSIYVAFDGGTSIPRYRFVDGSWSSAGVFNSPIGGTVPCVGVYGIDLDIVDTSALPYVTTVSCISSTPNINLYSYTSKEQLDGFVVNSPCIITATTTGIEITDYSTNDLLYSYIWSGADYFTGFSIGDQDYVEYGIGQSYECSSSEEPISLYLYSNQYPVLAGVWQANDFIKGSTAISQDLNFTVGDVSYTGITYQISGSVTTTSYLLSSGKETVYADQWFGDSKKTIDLGPTSQLVTPGFYTWFTSNFTRTGDSAAADDVGQVRIYDYASGRLLQTLSLPTPNIVFATAIGIQIEGYSTAETLFLYTWSGTGAFAGFSTLSRDWVEYEIGSNFVNMSRDLTLYLYGDIEDPIDPEDPDPIDPTEPEATDPTDPSDSGSTEPTVDPLDKEKEEINGSGNSALDDLTQAVPDYSQDFIAALGDLVRAFSYEGTNCELVIPALVLPGIDGLIPATELLPVTTVDFAEAFLIFPEKVVIVVRSLLTAALIIYCFKELYDTISYFLTLKRGDSNG